MFFRGNRKIKLNKKNKISLPGNDSIRRNSAPRRSGTRFPGRTAFCTSPAWKKASITVEAAFALPLFFLTVLSLISMMGIYSSYAGAMLSLQQKAEKQALLYIYRSDEHTAPVRLGKTVKEDLILLPFESEILKARVMSSVLPWTGRSEYPSSEEMQSSEGKLYYLSDYQSVYHTSSCCTYLSLQISAVHSERIGRSRNEHGERYSACRKCIGSGEYGSVVYVTPDGDHFHNSPHCSGLKRSIHLVEESDIAGLSMCSRCRRRE